MTSAGRSVGGGGDPPLVPSAPKAMCCSAEALEFAFSLTATPFGLLLHILLRSGLESLVCNQFRGGCQVT